ncbi:MAG: hypothetical protein EHM59_20780, partial [Betaproteobacteria bacterium]
MNTRSESVSPVGWRRAAGVSAPPGAALKTLAVATAMALLVLPDARGAHAQTIGELEVRSRLGERFYGAVPVQTPSGILDPSCIRVAPNPNAPPGAEALEGTRVRIGSADSVIIETKGAVASPIVGLRLEVGCERPAIRDFVVLGEGAAIAGLTDAPPSPAIRVAPAPAIAAVARAPRPRSAQPQRQRAGAPVEVPTAAPAPAQRSTTQSITPPPAAAPSSDAGVPARGIARSTAASAEPSDAARRVADLRARSDDAAAALLALDDRLALLQKQAELLKAQLEKALAEAPAGQTAAASAPPSAAPAQSVHVAATGPSISGTAPAPAAPIPGIETTPRSSPGVLDLLSDWGVAGGLAALLLGAFVLRRRRRPVFRTNGASLATSADDSLLEPRHLDADLTIPAAYLPQKRRKAGSAAAPLAADQTAEWVAPPTTDTMPIPDSGIATRRGAEPASAPTSREFHITNKFQPTTERIAALATAEEIVQQARTHYMEDGDVFRAIDLLEMTVSARRDSTRPWQALFAIYHREKMPERFQRLMAAYRNAFGEDENWPLVRSLGHAIDPDNPIYGGDEPLAAIPEDLSERWLGAPLDFTAHLLANEMHDQLMSTHPGRR